MHIYYSDTCLSYGLPGHPESPMRVKSTVDYLSLKGFSFIAPEPCTDDDVLRVHTPELLDALKTGNFFDSDTPSLPEIYTHAILSAGASIQAAESAVRGEQGFALMRPPGHHATRGRIMGFCYLNNIAIGAASYLDKNPKGKVCILDIDCHHGNGTEDIFKGNDSVLYVSLHQSPLYPGTGFESSENVLNYPLLPGTNEEAFLPVLDQALERIREFAPDLLGISAGFDTFVEDPLTNINLDIPSYEKIGQAIGALDYPNYSVMEGGYSARLPECVHAYIKGLMSKT